MTAQVSPKFHQARARAVHGKDEGQAAFILRVAADLNQIAEENIQRLPEPIFVEVFLPLFAGEELKYPKESTIAGWISIAGTPYKEVDIYDPATNKVLFRCPALFDYNGVNPVRNVADRGARPIAEIVSMAGELTNLHPNQGIAFLARELNKRALTMNTGEKLAPNVARWNVVFARYGRKPFGKENPNAAVAASVQQDSQGPDPDATYEDF
jgi:hypothetical protein